MFPHRSRAPRYAPWFVSVPLLAILVLLCATPVRADSEDPAKNRVGAAEYYAGLLAEEPEGEAVIVDDSIVGLYDPEELERGLHEAFGSLDVPYYVVASALPGYSTRPGDFLAAMQDRVGRPGLYVYLNPGSSEVTAVSREVNLPVDMANRVLQQEGELSAFTPLDAKADLFADTLVAPDLDERYEERWGSGWQVLGPAYWWADTYLRQLRLETYNGPERLGETAAFTVGLTITMTLVFGSIRSVRRKRITEAGHAGRPPGDRALATGMVLAVATGAVVMAASLIHLNTATLPKDVEQVGPIPPQVPPYVANTVRVERVAEALREEPLYVDPLAELDTRGLAEAREREILEELPVYVAVLPMSSSDESGGDGEIFAHALHHVMGQDGVFVVMHDSSGSAPQVETARFGVAFEDGGSDWSHLGEVTGYLEDVTTAQALDELLDVLEEELSPARGEASEVPSAVDYRADPSPEPSRLSQFVSGGFFEALFLIGPFTAAVFIALVWSVSKVPIRMRAVPGRALRPRADRAVRRMLKALRSAPVDHPGQNKALRESDMALTVLAGEPDELDLVGIAVLADRVVLRLDRDPETASQADDPVCMVNPLHGPSVRQRVERKERGRLGALVIQRPVCPACSTLSEQQLRNHTLRVAAPEGGRVPHLELDRRWVQSGYGAKYRLHVEDLLKESDVH